MVGQDEEVAPSTTVPKDTGGGGHLMRDYFRETTVHGFRYVVEGRSAAERTAWVAAIAAAFLYSSLLVHQALEEARENPISTSTEIAGKLILIWVFC